MSSTSEHFVHEAVFGGLSEEQLDAMFEECFGNVDPLEKARMAADRFDEDFSIDEDSSIDEVGHNNEISCFLLCRGLTEEELVDNNIGSDDFRNSLAVWRRKFSDGLYTRRQINWSAVDILSDWLYDRLYDLLELRWNFDEPQAAYQYRSCAGGMWRTMPAEHGAIIRCAEYGTVSEPAPYLQIWKNREDGRLAVVFGMTAPGVIDWVDVGTNALRTWHNLVKCLENGTITLATEKLPMRLPDWWSVCFTTYAAIATPESPYID